MVTRIPGCSLICPRYHPGTRLTKANNLLGSPALLGAEPGLAPTLTSTLPRCTARKAMANFSILAGRRNGETPCELSSLRRRDRDRRSKVAASFSLTAHVLVALKLEGLVNPRTRGTQSSSPGLVTGTQLLEPSAAAYQVYSNKKLELAARHSATLSQTHVHRTYTFT